MYNTKFVWVAYFSEVSVIYCCHVIRLPCSMANYPVKKIISSQSIQKRYSLMRQSMKKYFRCLPLPLIPQKFLVVQIFLPKFFRNVLVHFHVSFKKYIIYLVFNYAKSHGTFYFSYSVSNAPPPGKRHAHLSLVLALAAFR